MAGGAAAFAVVLSGALLFTEVNVEMPATLLGDNARLIASRVARLWVLAALGNLVGALLVGWAVTVSDSDTPGVAELFGEIVETKMRYREVGGVSGVGQAVLSGALANWLVGRERRWWECSARAGTPSPIRRPT